MARIARRSLLVLGLLAGCQAPQSKPPQDATPAKVEEAPSPLTREFLRTHTRALSDDSFEGRLPGTPGGEKAVGYIIAQMKALGLEPAGVDGWVQRVRMRGVVVDRASTTMAVYAKKKQIMPLEFGETWVGSSFAPGTEHEIDAELVFVGYGIRAPEQRWDDYAKVDVKGKIAVVLVGDPPLEDGRFGGPAMTYYGRWGYKFEAALAAGAIGCLVVHEDEPASYGWNVPKTSFLSERLSVLGTDGPPPALKLQGWLSAAAADELAKRSGASLKNWHERALSPDFAPQRLGTHLRGKLVTTERTLEDANVLGRLPGVREPDAAIMMTAHWDHLGTDAALVAAGKDGVHNGAIDNASGIASMLGVAAELSHRAKQGKPLDRSVVFLATTAEEQGLLGSRAWVAAPTIPHKNVVAVINLDSMNVFDRTKQVEVVGWGQTTLEDVLAKVAQEQGRVVAPDSHPESGGFYRSDHFPFAQVGIPALYFHSGLDMLEGGAAAGEAIRATVKAHYHTPDDEFDESWTFAGALEDAQLAVAVVEAIGQSGITPAFKAGSEFAGLRDKSTQP